MATLADQNKTFTTSMDKFTQVMDKLVSGEGDMNAGRHRRTATAARDEDPMEVDEEAGGDADDESEPLPVNLPRRKKAFKLTSLPVRRSVEENALKAAIPQMTLDLLGRDTNKSPFDLHRLPLKKSSKSSRKLTRTYAHVALLTTSDLTSTGPLDASGTLSSRRSSSRHICKRAVLKPYGALVKKFFVRHLNLINKSKGAPYRLRRLTRPREGQAPRAYLFNHASLPPTRN